MTKTKPTQMTQLNDDQNEMINKAAAHWGCTRAAAYRKLYPKWQRDLIKASFTRKVQ